MSEMLRNSSPISLSRETCPFSIFFLFTLLISFASFALAWIQPLLLMIVARGWIDLLRCFLSGVFLDIPKSTSSGQYRAVYNREE